jgi:hypothetical protein
MASTAARLPLSLESDHFILRYGLRNPREGKGLGAGGVSDGRLLNTYLDALERTYGVMTGEPWSRDAPTVGDEEKTVVYVFDVSESFPGYYGPFTFVDLKGAPFIGLTSGSTEPTADAELARAAAEAAHEAVHVFNWQRRAILDPYWEQWRWFDEGMAVLLEAIVLPGNADHLRFLRDWVNLPHLPIDKDSMAYQAGVFLTYLARRTSLSFINDVWLKSGPTEKPFDTIERLLPADVSLFSPDPSEPDIFGAGYCVDSYFLSDNASSCYIPEVFSRWGERAVTRSFQLSVDRAEACAADGLDRRACRYYRIFLGESFERVRVELEPARRSPLCRLKANISEVTTQKRRGRSEFLRPLRTMGLGAPTKLAAELTDIAGEVDHLVLTVCNCGPDDGENYSIKVSPYAWK